MKNFNTFSKNRRLYDSDLRALKKLRALKLYEHRINLKKFKCRKPYFFSPGFLAKKK